MSNKNVGKTLRIRGPKSTPKIEDIPLISMNVKILKFWSLILGQQMWRRYLAIIPYMLLNITQFLQLYYGTESAIAKIQNGFVSMLIFNTHLRAVHVCLKRKHYEVFLEYLRELYVDLREMKYTDIRILLEACTQRAQKLTKVNLIIGSLVCVGLALNPLFLKERGKEKELSKFIIVFLLVLMFSVYIPFLDIYQSPWYELVYFCHIFMTPSGVCMFIPFTILVVTFMLFAMLMCQVLQYKLRRLTQFTPQQIYVEVVWCIKYQLKMIRFVDSINNLTSYLFLMEYLLFGTMLCALLFSMIISTTLIQVSIIMVYLTMIFTQSFLMYYFANELYEESLEVANAAYDVNWYDCDVATQQTVKLLILRSQKSSAILIGNVYPMNLMKLQSLLNATYSFYTLLKRFYG